MARLRDHLRHTLRASPVAFGLIGRRGERAEFDRRLVRRGDDLVIEGYPRSGNTFATMAFRMAQPAPLKIGNHFHAPAQILRAERFGLPAMVVMREPRAAALSFVVYHQGALSAVRAVEHYIAFHKPLVGREAAFTIARFGDIITDFGRSIDQLNARFGTSFARFEANEQNTRDVQDAINAKRAKRLALTGKATDSVASMTTPSQEKKALQDRYAQDFATSQVDRLMSEATALFEAFGGATQVPRAAE